MPDSKKRATGAVVEEVVRRTSDPRSASIPPEMVKDMGLDARLMAFLLSERPPLQLGSVPPEEILESIPPEVKARFRAPRLPAESDEEPPNPALAKTEPAPSGEREDPKSPPKVEQIRAEGIGLPAAQPPAPPPPPRRSPAGRAKGLVRQLDSVGPGDEAPVVQALLRIGAPALPAVAKAFPGLLWFHRNLPHVAVPRGRDVSPLARTLVAFGDEAVATVKELLGSEHADLRFYALLVAQDLGAEAFIGELPALAVDGDAQIREIAAATLLGVSSEVRAPAREQLEKVLTDPRAPRLDRIAAIHALARLREAASLRSLVEVARDPTHADLQELAVGALRLLTGQSHGADPDDWLRFADKHENESRIEWLIEALRSTAPELVPVVLRELHELTGESFGDPSADDPRERKRAAGAYAKWWKQNGTEDLSLFGRLIRRAKGS